MNRLLFAPCCAGKTFICETDRRFVDLDEVLATAGIENKNTFWYEPGSREKVDAIKAKLDEMYASQPSDRVFMYSGNPCLVVVDAIWLPPKHHIEANVKRRKNCGEWVPSTGRSMAERWMYKQAAFVGCPVFVNWITNDAVYDAMFALPQPEKGYVEFVLKSNRAFYAGQGIIVHMSAGEWAKRPMTMRLAIAGTNVVTTSFRTEGVCQLYRVLACDPKTPIAKVPTGAERRDWVVGLTKIMERDRGVGIENYLASGGIHLTYKDLQKTCVLGKDFKQYTLEQFAFLRVRSGANLVYNLPN